MITYTSESHLILIEQEDKKISITLVRFEDRVQISVRVDDGDRRGSHLNLYEIRFLGSADNLHYAIAHGINEAYLGAIQADPDDDSLPSWISEARDKLHEALVANPFVFSSQNKQAGAKSALGA